MLLRRLYPDAAGNGPDGSGGGMAGSRWRGTSCTEEGHTAGDKRRLCKTASSAEQLAGRSGHKPQRLTGNSAWERVSGSGGA